MNHLPPSLSVTIDGASCRTLNIGEGTDPFGFERISPELFWPSKIAQKSKFIQNLLLQRVILLDGDAPCILNYDDFHSIKLARRGSKLRQSFGANINIQESASRSPLGGFSLLSPLHSSWKLEMFWKSTISYGGLASQLLNVNALITQPNSNPTSQSYYFHCQNHADL